MNKNHNQLLEEQIKALSIENKRLKEKELEHEETLGAVERLNRELKELEEDRDIQTGILNKTIELLKTDSYYNNVIVVILIFLTLLQTIVLFDILNN